MMAKRGAEGGTEPSAVTTTIPGAGTAADVRVLTPGGPGPTGPGTGGPGMPGTGMFGQLCRCRGTVLPSGLSFDGMYFRIAHGSETFTDKQVVTAPHATLSRWDLYGSGPSNVTANWNMDQKLPADHNAGGTATNKLIAVSRSFNYNPSMSNPYQELLESVTTPFFGKTVTACAALAPQLGRSTAAVTLATPPTVDGNYVGPKDSEGDWLLYSGLTASNQFFGNRLYRNGSPLRARVIAVAAANVDWSFDLNPLGVGRRYVRRAAGDLSSEPFRPSPWRFANNPANAVVVWQNKLGLPDNVVLSECRQTPDLIHLDPTEDVLVQVNYNAFLQSSITGTFSLWIKIVD